MGLLQLTVQASDHGAKVSSLGLLTTVTELLTDHPGPFLTPSLCSYISPPLGCGLLWQGSQTSFHSCVCIPPNPIPAQLTVTGRPGKGAVG